MKRTAQECEIRWKGDLHSSVNHRRWSDEEVEKVQKIIAEQPKPLNWTTVSKILGVGKAQTNIYCRAEIGVLDRSNAHRLYA